MKVGGLECGHVSSLGRRVRSVRRRLFEIPGRWPGLLHGGVVVVMLTLVSVVPVCCRVRSQSRSSTDDRHECVRAAYPGRAE